MLTVDKTKPALSIRGLTKVYAGGLQALRGIDLDVMPGDFFALLGPNGAGKSTTLGIVSGLVNKTEGQVELFGCDIEKQAFAAKRLLGVVPQEFNFNQFEKVQDILITQAGYYGIPASRARESAERHLRALGLWEKRDQQSRLLSGGMKRRLMVARALVHEPQLLILDEPTAGVDIELRHSLWQYMQQLNKEGVTIILTTHYLEEAEQLCRHIAIINKGEIVSNTSKRQLLGQLQSQAFTVELASQHELTADFSLPGFNLRVVDAHSFEVDLSKGESLNPLFAALSAQNFAVISIQPKSNRLESLFVDLVRKV